MCKKRRHERTVHHEKNESSARHRGRVRWEGSVTGDAPSDETYPGLSGSSTAPGVSLPRFHLLQLVHVFVLNLNGEHVHLGGELADLGRARV